MDLLRFSTAEMNDDQLLEIAKEASIRAGEAILEVYNKEDLGIESKADDSPLTQADKNAHEIIFSFLEKTSIPVLSEEGATIPFEERKVWDRFWMVDPLDGTKEFIKRNGEFTVNIALIENRAPALGIVYIPVSEELYWGNVKSSEAYYQKKNEKIMTLPSKSERDVLWEVVLGHKAVVIGNKESKVRILCSRSHMNKETLNFIEQFEVSDKVPMGSSLKFLKIAEGLADIYPRFGPTMEWDTAAAHGVIKACGYHIKNAETYEELIYNKANLLNPHFMAF